MTKDEKELIFNRLLELEEQHPAFAENVRDNAYCEAIADVKRIIDGIKEPSLPSGLDEAAEKYSENILANNEDLQDAIEDAFKAGAEWYDNQMKMPNSSELISAWRGVKSILQEKDFRGDEWRLAYNAFMFGFSRGINTQKTGK